MNEDQAFLPGLEAPVAPLPQGPAGRFVILNKEALYEPGDVDIAHKKLKASCGPCSFAAIAEKQVVEVMASFGGKTFKGWTNGRMMESAINAARLPYLKKGRVWPTRGLCWLQIDGPWCKDPTDFMTPCKHSHWVAVSGDWIYDWNARVWLPRAEWEKEVMNELVDQDEGATGFWPRASFQIFRRQQTAVA